MRELLREVFGRERRATAGYFQIANYSYLLGAAVFISMSNFAVYAILQKMDGFPLPLKILAMIGQILFSAFMIYLGFGFANYNFYVKPMRTVAQAARKVAEGDFSVRLEEAPEGGEKNEFSVLAEDFNIMVRELAGMETMRGDFISNVSHELKSPLAVISSSAASMGDGTLTAEQREEYRRSILAAAERLNGLVTNILKLNKLENQEIYPAAQRYALDEQMREAVLALEPLWDAKELELDIDLEELSVEADADLLELVWNNLLSNAIKFSHPGGLLRVMLRREGERAAVTVQDTGCGMDEETRKHIFEKFYQGDASRACQGNGLGLALVKRVLDIVGGEISVQSSPGEGSAFTVRLPLENIRKH